MVWFTRLTRLSLSASLLLLGAIPVLADPVETQVTFDGTGNGQNVSLTYNGNTLNVFAGQFKMHLDNQQGFPPHPEFLSFCVDLDHFITSDYKVYERSTADGLSHGGAISSLYQAYGESALDNQHAAALQLAIWDELIDGGDGLTTGLFRFSGDAGLASLVASYETAAQVQSGAGLWLDASANGTGSNRGQSVLMPGTIEIAAVPEPSSLVLLGLAGAALAAWRMRKVMA